MRQGNHQQYNLIEGDQDLSFYLFTNIIKPYEILFFMVFMSLSFNSQLALINC